MAPSDALITSSLRRVSTWANIIVALPIRQGLDDVFQDCPVKHEFVFMFYEINKSVVFITFSYFCA